MASYIVITIIVLFSTASYAADASSLTMRSLECLSVNSFDYMVLLKEPGDNLNHTGSLLGSANFLHSNTISSCLHLFELSSEELGLCANFIMD